MLEFRTAKNSAKSMDVHSLLDLPPELVLACLAYLPLSDVRSCLDARNRLLSGIILTSAIIRYRFEQERAGVVANPYRLPTPLVADGLRELRDREANWLHFTPSSRHTAPLGFRTTSIYHLASDVYLVPGDIVDAQTSLCTSIQYICTDPGSSWVRIEVGKPILDFGTALEEHDLIAMATYTRRPDNPDLVALEIMLLQFSTGARHPLAAHPKLSIHDVELHRGTPGISIEIVGGTLAISVLYWMDAARDKDTLHLYNWQSGTRLLQPLLVDNIGLTFVTPDILVVPRLRNKTLDIFRIPQPNSAGSENEATYFLRPFHLPELKQGHSLFSVECRGEPNPRTRVIRPTATPFLATPEDSIILFTVEVGTHDGTTASHMFVVSRARLAALLAEKEDAEKEDAAGVPWSEWGPRCARWLPAAASWAPGYITTTCGARMVAIAHDAWLTPAPIRILDFNPSRVKRAAEQGLDTTARVRVVDANADAAEDVQSEQLALLFAERLHSTIPYIETVSEEAFQYAAVLVNNEDIIGVKLDEGQDVGALDILRFG